MMLGRGSTEWGSRRSAMEKFDCAAGDLALCDRHVGEWVGLMVTPPSLHSGVIGKVQSVTDSSIDVQTGSGVARVDITRPLTAISRYLRFTLHTAPLHSIGSQTETIGLLNLDSA
jgi:hypothetical protein